jgi:hypothetical protein
MEDRPSTEELQLQQIQRERSERREAEDADLPEEERAHDRRADKASYLREKLAEQQVSIDGDGDGDAGGTAA